MRAQHRLAVLAAAGTMLMAAASVLFTAGVASANPGDTEHGRGRPGYHAPGGQGSGSGSGGITNYPAPPASVAVSSGTVRAGRAVRVTGNGFGKNEPVVVQTRYRPPTRFWFPRQGIVIGQQTVRTNGQGRFSTYAPTWLPGKVTISARGLKSGKTGSATVNVLPRGGQPLGWGGGWWGAGASGTPTGIVAVSHTTPAPGSDDNTALYVLTAALMTLAASSVVMQRASRRRRSTL